MQKIKELVDWIDDELKGAQKYAEKYVEMKAEGETNWAGKFKNMSAVELEHAANLHELAVAEIQKIKKVYTAPAEMQKKWDESHTKYVDKAAWIKQMLTM